MTGEEERIEMEIRKRNGESVPFQQEKIFNAMKKAFDGHQKVCVLFFYNQLQT